MERLQELPQLILEEGRCILKMASGTSMIPTIPKNAILQIEPAQQKGVKPGDIVFFTDASGRTKIHRIAFKYRRGIERLVLTWGDNCQYPDTPIPITRIHGRVIAYRAEENWQQVRNDSFMYFILFIKRYFWYCLKRLPARLIRLFNLNSAR